MALKAMTGGILITLQSHLYGIEISFGPEYLQAVAYSNRTFMELKYMLHRPRRSGKGNSNRTVMELKYYSVASQ